MPGQKNTASCPCAELQSLLSAHVHAPYCPQPPSPTHLWSLQSSARVAPLEEVVPDRPVRRPILQVGAFPTPRYLGTPDVSTRTLASTRVLASFEIRICLPH